MADALAPLRAIAETADIDDADLVVLNTCHIREKAAEKVYSELGRVRALKRERAADGRDAQDRRRRLRRPGRGRRDPAPRQAGVDLVVGPQSYHRLPELLARRRAARAAWSTPISRPRTSSTHLPAARREKTPARGVTAFLTVQEGCDKFCTFCVVPYTRGAEASRPVASHRRRSGAAGRRGRARGHAARPERQRLSRRRAGRRGAGRSARCCAGSPRSRASTRLRYTTSHPRDMDDELIAAHRDLPT